MFVGAFLLRFQIHNLFSGVVEIILRINAHGMKSSDVFRFWKLWEIKFNIWLCALVCKSAFVGEDFAVYPSC